MAKRRGAYKLTARRRTALKRAQAISARKRKGQRNKRIAVGVLAVAGVAGAAYAGHRYGGQAGNIARDLKSRFHASGISAGGVSANGAVRAAHQSGAKEATRIAGAISPASTPRPKVKKPQRAAVPGGQKTVIPRVSATQQSELMKRATQPKQPILDENGSVVTNPDRGIPKELLRGDRISARTAHGVLASHEKAKAQSGVRASTNNRRRTIVDKMIAEGTVDERIRGKKPRKQVKLGGYTESEWDAIQGD